MKKSLRELRDEMTAVARGERKASPLPRNPDPDDAPELTTEFFAGAYVDEGGKTVSEFMQAMEEAAAIAAGKKQPARVWVERDGKMVEASTMQEAWDAMKRQKP